ncbi:MAG: FtsX-like permease family protein, partial [Acidobacteriaceae bacterium]|nr:FtsX-like permease family protein [Acidobacteriaceae bacterium]
MSISAPISQRTVKSAQDPSGRFYWADTLARRREGATQLQLRVQLGTRWRRLLDAALPAGFGGLNRAEIIAMPPIVSSGATPVDYYFRDHFEKPLLVLLAISILVLIVSCVNVANLLLARGLQRQREIAIRVAMGAARWRLLRQLVAESGVLLSVALLSAFVLAFVSTRVLIDFFIRAFDRPDLSFTVGLDARLLMFTGLAAVLAVMIFAALPAWRSSDIDPAIPLRSESRSTTGPHARARRTLLCGQLAMTLVIVICANAFAESGRYLQDTAVNFNGDSVINIQLMPTARSESTGRTSESYFFNLIDRVSSLPGVARASLASFAPLVSVPFREDVRRLDEPEKKGLRAPA